MRVKQTARKSTARASDAVAQRISQTLQTKRRNGGQATCKIEPGCPSGKRITFNSRNDVVKTKPRRRPGEFALSEIKKYQKTTDLLIPRLSFHRLVRNITQDLHRDDPIRYQAAALEALQEGTEAYLTRLFEDSFQCTIHAKRVTLFPADMRLCLRLQQGAVGGRY